MRSRLKRFLAALGLTPDDVRDQDLEVVGKALEAADEDEGGMAEAVADAIVERLEKSPRKLAALLRYMDEDEDEDEDEEEEGASGEDEDEEDVGGEDDDVEGEDDDLDSDLEARMKHDEEPDEDNLEEEEGGEEEEAQEEPDLDRERARLRRRARKSVAAALEEFNLVGLEVDDLTEGLVKSVGAVVDAHNQSVRRELAQLRGLVRQQAETIEQMGKALAEMGERPDLRLSGSAARDLVLRPTPLERAGAAGGPPKEQVLEVTLEGLSKGLLETAQAIAMQKAAGTERWPQYADKWQALAERLKASAAPAA